jgi:hypothetical protein
MMVRFCSGGQDIMMLEAINLKFIAAPLTGKLIQIPPRRK